MTDFTHHTPRLLSDADAAADLAGLPRAVNAPLSTDVLTDLCTLHDRTGCGVWAQGSSSHETVLKREGQPDYHVASFRHADYASFVDAAHKYMPLLIGEVTDLRSERDALAVRVSELEGALNVYVTAIATAGGGDKQLFMAAIRQADDKARAALTTPESKP